jgi:hypothetical protein
MLAKLQTIGKLALKANCNPIGPYTMMRHLQVKFDVDLKRLGEKQERDEIEPTDLGRTNEE